MQNKQLRTMVLLILVCAMALSLAACGSGETSGNSAKTTAATAAPANEFKYVSSFTPVKDANFDYLSSVFYTENGFYASADSYSSESSMSKPIFIGYDGSLKIFTGYTAAASSDETNSDKYNFSRIENILSFTPINDGQFLAIVSIQEYWNDDPDITSDNLAFYDSFHSTQKTLGRILDDTGKEISSFDFDLGENESITNVAISSTNEIILSTSSGLNTYSTDGKLLWKTQLRETAEKLLPLKDGRLYFVAYGSNGLGLYPVDEKTHEAGDPKKLPNDVDTYSMFAGDEKHDFYYSSGSNFYAYDLTTGEKTKVFSWLDLDISPDMYNAVYISGDGTIYGYLNESTNSLQESGSQDFKVFQVKEVPASSVKEKKTLVLATLGLDYQSRQQIIKFNRNNEEYHVTVNDYSQYASGNDLSAGVLKLQTEILAGNSPDIIDLSKVAVERFAAKGLLEDLYPFIDKDEELNREDFLPNVLTAAENKGKLVSTLSGFTIQSLAGASDIVGNTPGWTYDEFNAALAQMPEGCTALDPSTTRKDILEICLTLDLNRYVDWATGKCTFDCQDFTNLLKFAKTFPASHDSSLDDTSISVTDRLADGMQMLMPFSLDSLNTSWTGLIVFGNHPFTYIGYPTATGESGNYIRMSAGFAMSAGCKNKEGAWQFLRTFFTDEYQRTIYDIPSNKSAFEYKLKSAMTMQYEKNEDGSYKLDEKGEKIPRPIIRYSIGSIDLVYYALSQEDADILTTLIENTTRMLNPDISILSIVDEQAEAFFQGQKSAEEVAKLIQSKVSIYVNEQR